MKDFLIALFFFGLVAPDFSEADVIFYEGGSLSGRVTSFDRASITYKPGCNSTAVKTISWEKVQRVALDDNCTFKEPKKIKDNFKRCETKEDRLNVFLLSFRGGQPSIVAEDVALTENGRVHFDTFSPWEQAHGSIDDVIEVSKASVCRSQNLTVSKYPKSYCSEPRQVAVEFDYKSPLSNKILTNGFSYRIEVLGTPPAGFDLEGFGGEVRSAFQMAILLWTSALSDPGRKISPAIREFIEGRKSSGGKYTLFTPPQVIQLQCPDSSTFVVSLHFEENEFFPAFPVALARAETEGRTIAINMKRFPCFRSENKFNDSGNLAFDFPDGCINLVPILTHELGHAFGVRHINKKGEASLMDSKFDRSALHPTDRDVDAFIAVLEQSIQGAAPGELSFISSSGVQPPEDWQRDSH